MASRGRLVQVVLGGSPVLERWRRGLANALGDVEVVATRGRMGGVALCATYIAQAGTRLHVGHIEDNTLRVPPIGPPVIVASRQLERPEKVAVQIELDPDTLEREPTEDELERLAEEFHLAGYPRP